MSHDPRNPMKLRDTMQLAANVHIRAINIETGEIVHDEHKHNLVVNSGLALMVKSLAGLISPAEAMVSHLGIGTSATAVLATDTALIAEVLPAATPRCALTAHDYTTDPKKIQCRFFVGTTQGNGSTIREAGLFNTSGLVSDPDDAMIARVTHSAIIKSALVAISYDWTISLVGI